jgi:hypothetical protein
LVETKKKSVLVCAGTPLLKVKLYRFQGGQQTKPSGAIVATPSERQSAKATLMPAAGGNQQKPTSVGPLSGEGPVKMR